MHKNILIILLFYFIIIILGYSNNNNNNNNNNMEIFKRLRQSMVDQQIRARGITDSKVLNGMNIIPRHVFVDQSLYQESYNDYPLPIGMGQTISQPYIVAYMIAEAKIKETDKLLEIGTGCGYAAAVASQVANQVYTIETIKELGEKAKQTLKELNINNVEAVVGDGSLGLPEHAPYDAIIVTCGAPSVPDALKKQLAINGRMIIPVRRGFGEELLRVTRTSETDFHEQFLLDVRFVPLIGEQGFKPST